MMWATDPSATYLRKIFSPRSFTATNGNLQPSMRYTIIKSNIKQIQLFCLDFRCSKFYVVTNVAMLGKHNQSQTTCILIIITSSDGQVNFKFIVQQNKCFILLSAMISVNYCNFYNMLQTYSLQDLYQHHLVGTVSKPVPGGTCNCNMQANDIALS